jgi:hypothetical protein
MSQAKKGINHPHYGKTHSQETRGKISKTMGSTILVYSLDKRLLMTFSSSVIAAEYFNCTFKTILSYARSQFIFQEEFILSLEPLISDFLPTKMIKQNGPKGSSIYVYSLDGASHQLLYIFTSSRHAAEFLGSNHVTILKYAKSQDIFRGKYILSLKELPL